MTNEERHELTVVLNGTEVNPWHKYNLKQNPFPQLAEAELDAAERQVNSLDGDPLTGPDDIRKRLHGFSEQFIEACIERLVPGKRVRFKVTFPKRRS